MRNGLYKFEVETPISSATGVVFLHEGKLAGGDNEIYFTGSYTITGDIFDARAGTGRHSTSQNKTPPIFGRDKAAVTLKGKVRGDSVELIATAAEVPGIQAKGNLTRLAD